MAEYERIIYTYGGGYAFEAATAHFRATLRLLNAQIDPVVRTRLHAATAHLALQAGRMSFDLEQHVNLPPAVAGRFGGRPGC